MRKREMDDLRREAEEQLASRVHKIESMERADLESLTHELAVHQVELEIQNEELRQARTETEESRDRYLDLYDFAPVGYFTLDDHNRVVEANLTGCRLLQVDRRKLLNKPFTKFIADDEADSFYFHRKKVMESDTKQTFELKMQKADGTQFYAQLDSINVGKERLLMAISDISEKGILEHTLKFLVESASPDSGENFFNSLARYLAQTLGMTYVCIDQLEGDELTAQTLAVYNQGAFDSNVIYALKDTPCGVVVGKTICCFPREVRKLFPKDAALQELIAESYVGVTLWSYDKKPIGLIAVIGQKPLEKSELAESVLKLVSVRAARELERMQYEQRLEKQYETERLLRQELESFSYSVSHDLRAPLRTLDGFSEVVIQDYGDKLGETGKNYLVRIRKASQAMSQLIDDMLKLSRVTRAQVQFDDVKLSDLVSTIARELKVTQPERQVEFVIQPEILVYGDLNLLNIAMTNLIENAWKFTGKRLQARIDFGVTKGDGESTYFVKDNGAGFDMKYADTLFQPFRRLHTEREFPGTGIGLATVQRIIHRHGGRIWAESEVGKGAVFYFTLEERNTMLPVS